MLLTNEQWQLLQPLFPPRPPAGARGRPPADDRRLLEAILWKLASNTPWYDLPPGAPPYQTCYRYYRLWSRDGLLLNCLSLLWRDLRQRGGVDPERLLSGGDIEVRHLGRRILITCPDHLRGTWQLTTLYIILGIALNRMRHPATFLLTPADLPDPLPPRLPDEPPEAPSEAPPGSALLV